MGAEIEEDEEEEDGDDKEEEDEVKSDDEELPPEPTRAPVPQGILSPLGWTVSEGGVEAPDASAMVNRVVQ